MWHFVWPGDTTADLLGAARALRPDLAIGDVTLGEQWLSSAANWRARGLTSEWRLQAGAELVLRPMPRAVTLFVLSPHGGGEVKKLELKGEQNAGEVLQRAARESGAAWEAEAAIMFAWEILHDIEGRSRRSLVCFNEEERDFQYIDLSSGRPAHFESRSCVILRFLSPSSALPSDTLRIGGGRARACRPPPPEPASRRRYRIVSMASAGSSIETGRPISEIAMSSPA